MWTITFIVATVVMTTSGALRIPTQKDYENYYNRMRLRQELMNKQNSKTTVLVPIPNNPSQQRDNIALTDTDLNQHPGTYNNINNIILGAISKHPSRNPQNIDITDTELSRHMGAHNNSDVSDGKITFGDGNIFIDDSSNLINPVGNHGDNHTGSEVQTGSKDNTDEDSNGSGSGNGNTDDENDDRDLVTEQPITTPRSSTTPKRTYMPRNTPQVRYLARHPWIRRPLPFDPRTHRWLRF